MEELLNAWQTSKVDQKIDLLLQVLQFGEAGIDFLISKLSDRELLVRAKAYQLLQDVSSPKVQQAIAPGLLFNPGDKLYYVGNPTLFFNDWCYCIYQLSEKDKIKHLATYNDYKYQGYKIVSFDEAAYIITNIPYYINRQEAQLSADLLKHKIISQISVTSFDLEHNQEAVIQWCNKHQIFQEVKNLELKKHRQPDTQKFYSNFGIPYDFNDPGDIYWSTVEEHLKSISNQKLLEQLWLDLLGTPTYIQEIVFDKNTYLTTDKYYSQIIVNTSSLVYMEGEEISNPEEAEISLLLQAFNHCELNTRNLAYQLLKGIDSESARQAIGQGLKLKSGDKIYSVYQSGIAFTDQSYLLWDEINYLNDICLQIYGQEYFYKEDPRRISKRIYCFVEKEQAEQAAEILHQELITTIKIGLGVLGFDWRKENPDFNLKQWCIDNNVYYKNEWDNDIDNFSAIWEIKESLREAEDYFLEDKLRRSRYIYHPRIIDTWCKDNHVAIDANLDHWDNYNCVLEYLYLPENIELLSRFWKDGVGSLAFVREEIIQQKVYIPIGEKLTDRTAEENKEIELAAKPENYEQLVINYLVNVLERSNDSSKCKLKALELLQDIDAEKAREVVLQTNILDSAWDNIDIPF